MLNKNHIIAILFLGCSSTSAANDYNTFAIKVNSWGTGYQTAVDVPAVVREGDLISLTFRSDPTAGFISSGTLHWTHGFACHDDRLKMYVVDVLGLQRTIKPDDSTVLEYAEPIGPVTQVVNMYNGRIGLSVARESAYDCRFYEARVGKAQGYYGNGNTVGAKYRIVKLGKPGAFSWNINVQTFFTRRDDPAGWINMGSLASVSNDVDYLFSGVIRGWCKAESQEVILDHKEMTPDKVNGNVAKSKITVACGGGAYGTAKLSLSGSGDKKTVKINDSLSSEIMLGTSQVEVPKDSSRDVEVTSTLKASGTHLSPGKFENTAEVITVEWI